jgi:DNA sulfur modification protein DndB
MTKETSNWLEIEGLAEIASPEMKKRARERKGDFFEQSFPIEELDAKLKAGWDIVRESRKTVRLKKKKKLDVAFEDRVWRNFERLGFSILNIGEVRLQYNSAGAKKQIDVIAIDEKTKIVILVECKTALQPGSTRYLTQDFIEAKEVKEGAKKLNSAYTFISIFASMNISWTQSKTEAALQNQIRIWDEKAIEYFENLAMTLGEAAKWQLYGELIPSKKISLLKDVISPASKTRIRLNGKAKSIYSFIVPAKNLQRVAFIHHKALGDSENDGLITYQRMIQKSRIKKIQEFAEGHGLFAKM